MKQSKEFGFSLIELMVAVLIVGILAGIAYPSYQAHVLKASRAKATACLLEVAQAMERRFTTRTPMNYIPPAGDPALPAVPCTQDQDLTDRYNLPDPNVNGAGTTFTLAAIPIGPQLADTACGALGYNHQGIKTAVGPVNECW